MNSKNDDSKLNGSVRVGDDEGDEEEGDDDEDYETGDDDDDEEAEDEEDLSDVSYNNDDDKFETEEEANPYSQNDHYNEEALPEFACRYCGIHDPACVAKCVESDKWFCNGTAAAATSNRRSKGIGSSSSSHLVHHLVRSRSHQVQLHPDSPLGDTILECYNCTSKNVFVLGFVPAVGAANGNGVVVLLCRVCVETLPALKDMDWDLTAWHPLIQDRRFLPWLIKRPDNALIKVARSVSTQQMSRLEEVWKTSQHSNATYTDLVDPKSNLNINLAGEEGNIELAVSPVLRVYDDGFHYQNILAPLVKMEADYDRQMKECLTEESVRVRWDKSLSGKHTATFSFHRAGAAEQTRIVVGDELRLKLGPGGEFLYSGKSWDGIGNVKYMLDSEVCLELRNAGAVPENIHDDYLVEYIWKSTSYDRMQNALKSFAMDDTSVSGFIYHKILGHTVDEQRIATAKIPSTIEDFTVPGLPALNESQMEAVKAVLQRPLSLIQGPPGTGKTVTSATLVYHLTRQNMGQVLVTAPSNVAVDQLTEKIASTGLRVVRLASKTRETVSSSVDHLCLHVMTPLAAGDEFKKLQRLKDEIGELSNIDQKKYRSLQNKTEREILQAADVICCTCVGAGDPRLKNFRFRQVLIDEATQAIEAEALIPIAMGAKQVVFVGDHCQLGPVVMCKTAAKAGLTQSLFERLVLIGIRPIRLQVQYRMHPALSEFPSNMFYEGSLQNGVTEDDRKLLNLPEFAGKEDFPWPVPSKPMFFYSITGMEEISSSGTSYLNRTEASYVEKCVTHLLRMGVTPGQIGVITPYDGQRKYVSDYMRRAGALASSLYEAIEVASVDAFQGREKDFILVSCVRSSETQGIGFLSDPRRLNVALTRARLGIIVMGNPRVLSKNPLWAALLLHFKEYECLVEGPLNNLQPSYITLVRPKRDVASDSRYAFTAFARGGWDGRWEDQHNTTNYRSSGGNSRNNRRNNDGVPMDSRFDSRYNTATAESGEVISSYTTSNASSNVHTNRGISLPIPSFAPLPNYNQGLNVVGGDDNSSVGGDSAFDSQYGGNQSTSTQLRTTIAAGTSLYSQVLQQQRVVKDDRGPALGYLIGGGSTGGTFYRNVGE
jgi:regulator of nonsense transcripts 1